MTKFITFEGGEGSGKTTQSRKLYEYLVEKNIPAIWTREIGGTELAEKIRELVVNSEMSISTELLLIMAARSDHIEKIIKPALKEKKYVICDRFLDSTAAYQATNEEDIKKIFYLHNSVFGNFGPDYTIYMNLDPKVALKRAIERGDINKYEGKPLEFHKNISNNYKFLAESFRFRIREIDASLEEEKIFANILLSLKL